MANSAELMTAYISQLNPMEQKVMNIATSHLESSFSLSKSIGFQEWLKAQIQTAELAKPEASHAKPSQALKPPAIPKPIRKKIRIMESPMPPV